MKNEIGMQMKIKTKIKIKSKIRIKKADPILILILILIPPASAQTNVPQPIDLPTALRLAGAQNLDVKIARERLAEARANHLSAVSQFFPWLSPGVAYRQHEDKIQDVAGNIIDVHKYSYAPGAAVGVQLDLGDAIYKSLAAKQLAKAADHALEAQRQDSVLAAAQGYFELALTQGAVGVANEAVRIAGDYETQLGGAVEAGIAFRGDLLRARVQAERNRLGLRQAREQQRLAAARLAQVLRLDPAVELVAQDADLAPLTLIETNAALDSLVQGFGNGRGAQALLAYLESRAAIELIETRREGSMAGFLRRAAAGEPWQEALRAETGWDSAGLERALQAEVRSRFPADPLAVSTAR